MITPNRHSAARSSVNPWENQNIYRIINGLKTFVTYLYTKAAAKWSLMYASRTGLNNWNFDSSKRLNIETNTWNTNPLCVVEFPSSVENSANKASNTSCRNFTNSSSPRRNTLWRESWILSGCDFHLNKDRRSTAKHNIEEKRIKTVRTRYHFVWVLSNRAVFSRKSPPYDSLKMNRYSHGYLRNLYCMQVGLSTHSCRASVHLHTCKCKVHGLRLGWRHHLYPWDE